MMISIGNFSMNLILITHLVYTKLTIRRNFTIDNYFEIFYMLFNIFWTLFLIQNAVHVTHEVR